MCGIAGVIATDGAAGRDLRAGVTSMTDALRHRGPDGQGVIVEQAGAPATVAFGHTRLSILDLSDRGAQPMWRADRSAAVTFNGEIYNFRLLRDELEARGHVFTTGTDTEVILEGYAEWGVGVLDRLRGMFA